MSRIYLDHNATTPLRAEARAAMMEAMDVVGNPSSVHAEGRAAKMLVERARGQVAGLVGCLPQEVVFTSGATEAASVLRHLPKGVDVFVDETAHDALWALNRMSNWVASPKGPGHTLAMGLANSETGIVTPPPAKTDGQWPVGRAAADWLLLDVTQAAARLPYSFSEGAETFAILSAHKLGGPKGIGALIVRQGIDIRALSEGGGQEMGRRSGTENVTGIAGFGAAAEAAKRDIDTGRWDEIAEFRNILELALEAGSKQTIFVGKEVARLPNTSCFITQGWKGETQVMQMDLAGFAISAGSACSSGKVRASRVLAAMGYSDAEAGSAIRVSLGLETRKDDVLRFAEGWLSALKKHQARAA